MLKKLMLLFTSVMFIFALTACGGTSDEDGENENATISTPYSDTEFLMGTVVTISIFTEGKENVLEMAFDRVRELAGKVTVNEDGSEVEEINMNAGIAPVTVSEDTFNLIEAGLDYSEYSNGAFNAVIGPLTQLWSIGFDDARKPEQSEIDEVLPLLNYQDVEINRDERTVFLKEAGMRFDFGALAKGFITDEVVKVLIENDVQSAIIDLGGNIYVLGRNTRGNEWTVGIQDPFSVRGSVVGSFSASNLSIVTSGIYERYLEVDGVKYHHILNSETGYPFDNDIAGVSIVSEKSIDGDGLTTVVFAKGIEEGLAFIETVADVEAIFISHGKEVYVTSGLEGKFQITNDEFTLMESN